MTLRASPKLTGAAESEVRAVFAIDPARSRTINTRALAASVPASAGRQGAPLSERSYRLTFYVADYFSKAGRETFFAEIVVSFRITAASEHYHVPLLLSPIRILDLPR